MTSFDNDTNQNNKQIAKEFWHDFDNVFLFNAGQDERLRLAYQRLFFQHPEGFDYLLDRWRHHINMGTYPSGFISEINIYHEDISYLSQKQLEVMNRHFNNNNELQRLAFEYFAQGILFDDRPPREEGDYVHKMDYIGPEFIAANPPVGYHRWHAFIRSSIFLGVETELWEYIDKTLGLAWEIQSEMKPTPDNPNNPEMQIERLTELREKWLNLTLNEIDQLFMRIPYPNSKIIVI